MAIISGAMRNALPWLLHVSGLPTGVCKTTIKSWHALAQLTQEKKLSRFPDYIIQLCAGLEEINSDFGRQSFPPFQSLQPSFHAAITMLEYSDARIAEIFNANARRRTGISWPIVGLMIENSTYFRMPLQPWISQLVLCEGSLCNLGTLRTSLQEVNEELTRGWHRVDAETWSSAPVQGNSDEYILLQKKDKENIFENIEELFQIIFKRLSLKAVFCFRSASDPSITYLWIKRECFREVKNTLCLNIEDE